MTTNEIKKDLYRNKPTAFLKNWDGNHMDYSTVLSSGESADFSIPKEEVEESFLTEMPAQLLIRWLI